MTSLSSEPNSSPVQVLQRKSFGQRWYGIAAVGFAALLVSGCSAVGDAKADAQEPAGTASYVSQAFDAQVLEAAYPSDGHHDWIPLLDGYDDLLNNHPEILDRDMELVVEINHGSADVPGQRERALEDQYEDMSITMGEGFGKNLGEIYITGRINGDLPKTEALLAKEGGRAGAEGSSSNPAKEHWATQAPRPYVAEPDAIDYFDREGGDAHGSTGGAYPSGHTSQAYWQGVTLATLMPELADGILARVSEAGNNRIVMGAHYPTDVIGGRISGTALVANRWADEEFHVLFDEVREELVGYLESECGAALEECIAKDTPFLAKDKAAALYLERMTYGFDQIGDAGLPLVVPATAPSLLITSHPELTDDQRRQVLELTAIDSGYPLDKQDEGTGWQRLNLFAAMAADVTVDDSGNVQITQ